MALDVVSPSKAGASAQIKNAEALLSATLWNAGGTGRGQLSFPSARFKDLPFIDYQDQLPLDGADWFPEPVAY